MNARDIFVGFTEGRERPTGVPGETSTHVAAPRLPGAPEPERLPPPPTPEVAARLRTERLYLSPEERATGMHVIGAPGTGKSKFLEWLIRGDLNAGHGVALIDPHGVLYENILAYCARYRPRRPIYRLNLSEPHTIFGFNPFLPRSGPVSTRVGRCVMAVLKAWGIQRPDDTPRLVRWLRNAFTVAMEHADLAVPELEFLFDYTTPEVRAYLTRGSSVTSEWELLAAFKRPEDFDGQIESTKNRLSALYRELSIRRFMALTDVNLNVDLGEIMDRGGVLLVNLKPSPYLDAMNARVFGTMLMTEFFDVARQRKGKHGRDPQPFYLYCDEAQNYVTPDVAEILAQGRKMGLSLILAHQYLEQLSAEDPRILAALNGACRTKVVFGIGSNGDATALVHELFPGQIDYHEVKRIDYSVQFWPVYGRDETRTKTRGESDSHTEGVSSGSASNSGTSSADTMGDSWPKFGSGVAGTTSMGRTTGRSDGTSHTEGSMSSDTHTDSYSESVADIPIYHPTPFLEGEERPWSPEEQRQRLADMLRLQFQRHCFIRTPDMRCRPVLIPHVREVMLSEKRVAEYAAELDQKTGALPAPEVDLVIEERHRLLRQEANNFDAKAKQNVHSKQYAEQPRGKLRPKRRLSTP